MNRQPTLQGAGGGRETKVSFGVAWAIISQYGILRFLPDN